jgi:hypothetical protein
VTYATGDIPACIYCSTSIANLGIGHGAIDGGDSAYFDQQNDHDFSGVPCFTDNLINPGTQHQRRVDMHFNWGASQFLT